MCARAVRARAVRCGAVRCGACVRVSTAAAIYIDGFEDLARRCIAHQRAVRRKEILELPVHACVHVRVHVCVRACVRRDLANIVEGEGVDLALA